MSRCHSLHLNGGPSRGGLNNNRARLPLDAHDLARIGTTEATRHCSSCHTGFGQAHITFTLLISNLTRIDPNMNRRTCNALVQESQQGYLTLYLWVTREVP